MSRKVNSIVLKRQIKVTELHTCKEAKKFEDIVTTDARMIMDGQVRSLATNEPTFSASKIALEVMRANEEELKGLFKGNSHMIYLSKFGNMCEMSKIC